jgi:hypothetical protein
MPAFESTAYDGQHSWAAGNDWRTGSGLVDSINRVCSYGNYAGAGNRILEENKDYVAQQRQLDPNYNENRDPRFMNDPHYAPIDGLDAAAKKHDSGYPDHLGQNSMFSWDGMQRVREDDRQLVTDVGAEMAQNGSKYSAGAQRFAAGTQGFFGGRVLAQDAVDWVGSKADQVGAGVAGFAAEASHWGSVGEAAHGIGTGAASAASWLTRTGHEAADGTAAAASQIGALGAPGMAMAALGVGNVAFAGMGHLASEAASGVAGAGKRLASSTADVFRHFAD